jgi:hypothetical protein
MQYYGYYRNKLEAVTLVLLIEKIYELMRWDGLRCLTMFDKGLLSHSKFNMGENTQTAHFYFFKIMKLG